MIETYESITPLIAVLLPVGAALLVLVTGERYRNVRDSWSTIAALVMVGVVASMLPDVLDGRVPQTTIIELSPGIDIAFRADSAGMIFALLASSLWVVASVYAVGYMRAEHEHKQTRFFVAFALSLGAAAGVAFSANLMTFVLSYELLTLFTFPLVTHRETAAAITAGRKYLTYTLTGGLMLIGGTAWVHMLGIAGTFVAGGLLADEDISKATAWGLLTLLMVGVGVKSAVMPLHGWLPSAMVAPTPVSALLHAVAVVKAGVFGVVRMLVFVFGAELLREIDAWQVIAVFAASTLIIGSLLALRHDNLKRRLAYSTISHLSYIVLGIALLGPIALVGALLHIVGHGVTKITLFFVAGAINAHTHKENVSELDGIGWQMPITMGAFTLASLSLVGIPPFVLFTSKFYLGWGAAEVDQQIFMVVYLVSGVLASGYLFPIIYRAFWKKPADAIDSAKARYNEADMRMVAPLAITGVLALFLGIAPNLPFSFFELATNVATAAFGPVDALAGGVR
jgi:multicomponent Na+:H+ antiporter subunit D